MKILVFILTIVTIAQCESNVKTPAKRAILGQGHIENSISDPNKNAYLPPPIQQYPVEQSHSSQQSGISSSGIEPPASTYLPPFETAPAHDHFQNTQNGFVPVSNSLGGSSQYRAAGYLPPTHDHEHLSHQSSQPHQPSNYRAPDYLPPLTSQSSGHSVVPSPGAHSSSSIPGYLPPHPHQHSQNQKSAYNAPGYLPPLSAHEIHGNSHPISEGSYRANGYLPPHETNSVHHNPHSNHASYNAPGYLPPVSSHQAVSARVPPSVDFDQSEANNAYKAAGYLPPVSGPSNHEHAQLDPSSAHQPTHNNGQNAQIPHTVYGTPKSHSHASVQISPSINTLAVTIGSQYSPSNTYGSNSESLHESHYSNSGQPNYNGHQQDPNYQHYSQQSQNQHQQPYNAAQQPGLSGQSHSAEIQAYTPNYAPHSSYQGSQATPSISSQSYGIPVPHEYTAPLPMYSPNPISPYAAEAPIYETNNGYLPPHPDLLPPSQHHHHVEEAISSGHSNNGYIPPIHTEQISGEHSGNDVQFSSNQIQNTGSELPQQQYASSFPTYSSNHDGYDYSKPHGTSFEDGHTHNSLNQNYNFNTQNTIIQGEPQSNLNVINVGNEGGHQQEIKIVRIIDETGQGAIPNIRTIKIIKETSLGEPNHSSVQTIRIISEASVSPQVSAHVNNPPVQSHVSVPSHISVPQVPEQHDLHVLRSESAGENVEGGYLPPPVILQPPVIQPPIEHHSHVPQVHHPHIPQTVPYAPPPPPPSNHNHQIHPVPNTRQPLNGPEYLPPIAQNPASNVKILRILHDSNFDQQQDAIYAGVAEHNGNDINTIQVIHQQEAATSGRYGYPSPQINTVKLLRYYRRY